MKPGNAWRVAGLMVGLGGCISSSVEPTAITVQPPPSDMRGADGLSISGTPATLATVGTAYNFVPTVSNPGGGSLTFSITSPPAWARFDTRTGALAGTPAAADVASYPGIVIKVSDGTASASLAPFSITVNAVIAPTDLCGGLLSGKAMVSFSALPKPGKGQKVIDPDFHTKLLRVTDAKADWNAGVAIPVYPTIQAWNADESLMILYVTSPLGGKSQGGHALFDGRSYAFKKFLPINPADVEQFYWDTTNPDILYLVENYQSGGWHNVLTRFHVSTGVKDVIHDFSKDTGGNGPLAPCAGTTSVSGGEDPFSMSQDNDLIGLGCYLGHNGPGGSAAFQAFSYRISTNTIGKNFLVEATPPQALPSGTGTYAYYDSEKKVEIHDPVTNAVVRSFGYSGQEHSDMFRNAAGDDIVAGPQYDGPAGSGTLMWANLSKGGAVQTLIGLAKGDPYPAGGTLLSGRAYKRPGWVAVAVIGEIKLTSTYLDQEIFLANVDTGAFCRAVHHRSTGNFSNAAMSNYWAQPNVTISPSGTRILFQSDWGAETPGGHVVANPNAIVDTYVLELPAYAP